MGHGLGGTSIRLVLWILISCVVLTLFLTLSSNTERGRLDVWFTKHGFVYSMLLANTHQLSLAFAGSVHFCPLHLRVSWCTSLKDLHELELLFCSDLSL